MLIVIALPVAVALAKVGNKAAWLAVAGLTTVFGTVAWAAGATGLWSAYLLFFIGWGGLSVALGCLPSGDGDLSLLRSLVR